MAQPQKQQTNEERIKTASVLQKTFLVFFVGAIAGGYYLRETIDATGLSVIFAGVILTLLVSAIMLPWVAKKEDPKERGRAFLMMAMAESAILWGCVIHWVLTNGLTSS